jgi:hypothetical protein
VARHFHPDRYQPAWIEETKTLSRTLGIDSVKGLERIILHVEARPRDEDDALVAELEPGVRACDAEVTRRARALGREVERRVGRGRSLSGIGDRVATTLQRARSEEVSVS